MALGIHYRGGVYRIRDAAWRGPDGHVVHLLTWVTDDLLAREDPGIRGESRDRWLAERVARTLGAELL